MNEVFAPDDLLPELEKPSPARRDLSPLEFLPGWLVYGPIVAQWVALGLRYGDQSLPTASNPRITTGGLCGESKSAILGLAGERARRWIAPYTLITTGEDDPARARAAMASAGLSLPIVVKPDVGCNGTGVRLARDDAALDEVLASFPRGVDLMLQRYIRWEGEAGIFYIRHPDQAAGRITSLTLKYPPAVTGDGIRTLRQLIEAHPRHHRLARLYAPRLGARLDAIPRRSEPVKLVFAGNHCKGSIFRDARHEVTPALEARIDAIARDLPDYHFGRIDVRYRSLASLRAGEGFSIIEINGVGSEATHIWDPDTSLAEIWRAQLAHYGTAFRIGAAMRARGARPSGLAVMARDWFRQRRLLRSYPLND